MLEKFLSSESTLSPTPLCSHFVINYSIPHKITPIQEQIKIILIFPFLKSWLLIHALKDQFIGLILFRALQE